MLNTISVSPDLETLLGFIAEDIQLPASLDEKARDRYRVLTAYLQGTELSRFSILVYAQGSYRIGTTVKPLDGEEYDLDFILELTLPGTTDPSELFDEVWKVLQRNHNYAGMLERKASCIRIRYADEFHMDIVPAIPDDRYADTSILIPRESNGSLVWHGTNPRGYAAWFESQATARILTKELAVEPLPPVLPADEKTPLQTAIQLLKRNHHIVVGNEALRTPSVVLTTIAAQSASGPSSLGDVFDILVEALSQYIGLSDPPTVINPAAAHEVLSEKWEERGVFQAFKAHAKQLATDWRELLDLQGRDVMALTRKLSDMFGEPIVQRAFKKAEEGRQAARAAGLLSTGAGGILHSNPSPRTNKPHTYYGGAPS